MKILALTKYSYEGPSSRYRFYNYQKCFKENGIDMTIKPFFSNSYFTTKNRFKKIFIILSSYFYRLFIILQLIIFKNRYKLILVEYELFPFFPAIFEYIFYKRGIRYIVDYDDAIFHKYDMSKNRLIKTILKDKISYVIKYATKVIVCNSYLEDYAKKYNSNIIKLSTVVLLDKYKKKIKTFQKKDNDTFVIGWIGSRTTSFYILEILPAIKRFVTLHSNVRFDLVGFDESLLSTEDIKKHHLNIIKWKEETEVENILAFDIGIMPLHDDPWSKGKCGFKLIQYMTCKKPVIASPVGINSSIVKDGENGFLVKNIDEWFEAFEELYVNRIKLNIFSANNFQKIQDKFNYYKNCKKYCFELKNDRNYL
jgi:glycosyltransferase involved in cell wall biosynthesis